MKNRFPIYIYIEVSPEKILSLRVGQLLNILCLAVNVAMVATVSPGACFFQCDGKILPIFLGRCLFTKEKLQVLDFWTITETLVRLGTCRVTG